MKGTEKQIAWAQDIINKPAEGITKYAEKLASSYCISDHAAAQPMLRAVETYRSMISGNPKFDDARTVIDNRNRFGTLAVELVRRALIEDGIHPSNILANLARIYGVY